jgi:hypothetical protein
MGQVPSGRYPAIRIWNKLVEIINNDSYFANSTNGILYIAQATELSLIKLPLSMENFVPSDLGYALGIWHENQVELFDKNNMTTDNYKFYIDVARVHEDTTTAIEDVIKLCRDIVWTFDNVLNLDGEGQIMPNKNISPTEALPYDNMFVFMSSITLNIQTNTIYR